MYTSTSLTARFMWRAFIAGCAFGAAAVLPGCDRRDSVQISPASAGNPIHIGAASTFTIVERDGYHIVDLTAPILSWGGGATGPEQRARLVLVPRDHPAPELRDELAGATIVRTPVMRVATNHGAVEAMLAALGVEDRLVAVGGVKSYNDAIRARALAGEIGQVGYGWHMPPNLDVLVAAKPDLFLMSLGDLSHAERLKRIQQLGIAVTPVFLDAERDYMGKVEYLRLIGLLTARESQAQAHIAQVEQRIAELKALALSQPRRKVISAWYAGGDTWMATVRNADAQLLRDANADNLLAEPDDIRLDAVNKIGTELLVQRGRDADCWILRDPHSSAFPQASTLQQFKAYREACVFAADGRAKPEIDAYDLYETAVIRPDLVLEDLIRMLHPAQRGDSFVYIRPDTRRGS